MKRLLQMIAPKSESFLKVLLLTQCIIIAGTYLYARTSVIAALVVSSFIPALTICFLTDKKRYVLASLILLFISQHAVFIFSHPAWGFDFRHDSINDFHIASVIFEDSHFNLGQVGYGSQSYSFYVLLHLFSMILSEISGITLISIALYIVPILNASLTSVLLYTLNSKLFGLKGLTRNMATLLFAIGWYYTFFQSQFARETYAFPLVLLSIIVAIEIVRRPSRKYVAILSILFVAVILSHHTSSYMLFLILLVMALTLKIFHHENRLNKQLLLMGIMLLTYISFVVFTLFFQQAASVYQAFHAIFQREGTPSIMVPYETWRVYLAISYYVIICIFAALGGIRLLHLTRKRHIGITLPITLTAFFVLVFLLSTLMRLSVKASPLSWTYDMSLRGTIWAFLGLSFIGAIGFRYTLKKIGHNNVIKFLIVFSIICVLAAGNFAQHPLIFSDPTIIPDVTYSRYASTLWLKGETTHGSNMLVAPHTEDPRAFEASRSMAPYAYLRQYFGDEGRYNGFNGYIPFIGGFFDQFNNLSSVDIIYNNGETRIGYKGK